ncbi:MAG: hypothetical protein BalsKO_13580 [Balneolaceae bacterium]
MKFPVNDIITLLDKRLEFNLAESTNKDLILNEIWDDEFSKELKNLKLEYGTSKGNKELREKIGQKIKVDKNQIVITNGSAFAMFLSMLCLCEVGDEVITVQPNFPPTMDLIEGLGFKRVLVKLSFEDEYRVNINKLFSQITNKTRLIILVSPLNPTGTIHSKAEVLTISERLNNQYPNCRLIIDETYSEATYGDNATIPSYAGLKDNIITISSLSKCHGTPGLRIGWLQSSDKKFIEQVGIAKMNTVISNSVLDEFVALRILNKESEIFKNRRKHSIKGFELTQNWVVQNNELIDWVEPKAGALCCIKLKEERFTEDAIEAFYSLAKKTGIQIANGEWFGESKSYFRLGFGYMEIEKLDLTLNRLSGILKKASTPDKDQITEPFEKEKLNLNGKKFSTLSNSNNGEVSSNTVFEYRQKGNIIWATYQGGDILFGTLSGRKENEKLIFTYQHQNRNGDFKTGKCKSTIECIDEKLILKEIWEWTCDDYSKGESVLKEIS